MRLFLLSTILCLASSLIADDHIVIVFDSSGSMHERMRGPGKSRLEVAKDALTTVLSQVPETTKIGIITFNGWAYDLQPANQEKMTEVVGKIKASGGTPLYHYIKDGATRLLEERDKNNNAGYYKLLVITDGEAGDSGLNEDEKFGDGSIRLGVLKDIFRRGIIVDCIGLDMKQDHTLKTKINGSYMRGDDADSLTQAVRKSVAEIGFGTTKDVSEDAFKEISQMPEGFILVALKGLTTFSNQPVGTKLNPENVEIPNSNQESISLIKWFFGFALGFCLVVVVIVVCNKGSR